MSKKVAKSARKPRAKIPSKPKPRPRPGHALRVDAPTPEVLEALYRIVPKVRTVVVQSPDVSKNLLFLDLAKVCYISSRSEKDGSGRDETVFVTLGGGRFYNNESLNDLAVKFQGTNPWMLRTHRSYIVNVANLRGFNYSSERDLFFTTIEEPLLNAVSTDYREDFDAAMGL